MKSLVIAIACLSVCLLGGHHGSHGAMEGDYQHGDNMVLMNFKDECMDKMNDLIFYQIGTVFQDIAIAVFHRRHDVDIIGMSLMYNALARKKLNSSKMMMMEIIKRGGTVTFVDIPKPETTMWRNPGEALQQSLMRERKTTMMLNNLAKCAKTDNDFMLMSFLQENMVNAQAGYLFEVAAYVKKLENGGPKFGLLSINAQMIKKYKEFVDTESDVEKYKWNY